MAPLLNARRTFGLLLLGVCLLVPARAGAVDSDALRALLHQAEACEKQADWDKACDLYEAALRLQRDLGEVKDRYHHSLRRLWQVRRHRDASYRKEVLSVDYGQALRLYSLTRDTLLDNALDRDKIDPAKLFRKGLEELDYALGDASFCEQHVAPARLAAVPAFRAQLVRQWGRLPGQSRQETLKQVREIALAAQSQLQLSPTVVILEFACGSCYALDEYTVYLTPNQLRELCQSLKGEAVGVGLSLVQMDDRVIVQDVAAGGPAADAGLARGDHILRIDKKALAPLTAEAIKELLEGPAGSVVELEVATADGTRVVPVRRKALFVPSVSYALPPDSATAYLRITNFQDTTAKELDDALAQLSSGGMKALVLDLRGNGGGLFDSAIDVARRFLAHGVLASTRHRDAKFNAVYHARNPAALALPLVVLIDVDTASAAEVLAGALKDNGRASLVGQTSFGKGCTQCLLKLPTLPGNLPTGGLRLTVARFHSPKGQPYTGRGVVPDVPVERFASMSEFDSQLAAAVAEADRLLMMAGR